MDTEKIQALLAELSGRNANVAGTLAGVEGYPTLSEVAAMCNEHVDGLTALLDTPETPERFGPLLYSLRSIYSQMAQTRAMVDVPRLADWADTVIARIKREVAEPSTVASDIPTPAGIPEGAKEFVIFESLVRPGYRVACYHMGAGNELFGLDQKPRVVPDHTKWRCVAYYELPAAMDLIPPAALALPGDEGLPDWKNAELPAAPVGESAQVDDSAAG